MAKKYLDGINFDAPSKGFQGTLTIRDTEARGLIQDNANGIATLKAKEQADRRDIDTNTDEITALKNRCVDIEDKNEEQDDRLTTAEHNIVSVTSRVTIAEQDIDNLETRMDTAEADIDALEGRMTTAETDIDNLETRMDTAEADIDAVEGRMTTAEGDIDALEGRMTTAEGDITDIKAKDVEQDAHLADLDDRVAASTYEAGIGIYFGQGVKHTNINVEDELIDQINQNTQDIEELRETKTEIYTEENGERVNYPELTIDDTLQINKINDVDTLRVGNFKVYGLSFVNTDYDFTQLHAPTLNSDLVNMVKSILRYTATAPGATSTGHNLPLVQVINGGKEHYMYSLDAYATVDVYTETSGMVSFIVNDCQSKVPESGARKPDTVWSVSYNYSYNRTDNTASITNLTVNKVGGGALVVNDHVLSLET